MNEDVEIETENNNLAADESVTTETVDGSEVITPEPTDTTAVEVVSVEPFNSAGLTHGQTTFFAFGFFVLLMVVYFICQRGSYNGRNT